MYQYVGLGSMALCVTCMAVGGFFTSKIDCFTWCILFVMAFFLKLVYEGENNEPWYLIVSFVTVVLYIRRQPRTKSTGLVKLELATSEHLTLDPLIALFDTLLSGGETSLRRG